jgi:predicted AlkP superfamily pyrophosphatase or phosphodiesterase
MTRPVVVLNVVGLTPALLRGMPRLRALAESGTSASLGTVLPALTCSVQATLLTGTLPRAHGIVGNGWFFRELGEVFLWRQSNALVQGDKVWHHARRSAPGYRVANVCWWYALGAATDVVVTPRPIYHADGRKSPDCYTRPAQLHDELERRLGPFPLFSYWGANAGIASSQWIAAAARYVLDTSRPDLALVYLPHLDYDLQRHGPGSSQAATAARAVDEVAGLLADAAQERGAAVVVLSEYGITAASQPVDVNRVLRRAGLLEVSTQAGMEYLDPHTSRAFAVADHQVAHVYVRNPADVPRVAALLSDVPGVAHVLDEQGKQAAGLDHERSGELVLVAGREAWFTYYYWLDDARAPDFARTVDIHRKPGYDPAELFLDPADRLVKARAGLALAKKRAGLRYTLDVVPLDPSWVKGTHGRLPDDRDDGPVFLCSEPLRRDHVAATDVRDLLLEIAGLDPLSRPSPHVG